VCTIAEVLNVANQWAVAPATVDDVLDAQRWPANGRGAPANGRSEEGGTNPMMFVIGIALALAVPISVALHEWPYAG
jgi:hypothetical protein